MQESRHGGGAVEHALIHVDVEDLRAVLDLLARDGDGFLEFLREDEFRELGGARDVGAFADVDESARRGGFGFSICGA